MNMTTMRTTIKTLALVLCIGLVGGGVAAAQPPAEPPARGRPGNPAGLSPVEVLNMLDAYALVQAESALELRDGQYGEFVTRLKRLQETRRRNQQDRNRQIQELRRQLRDYDATSQATPAMGELIVSLYQQERLWTSMYEAYTYAAIEYNGAGDPWTATKCAFCYPCCHTLFSLSRGAPG